jgi:P27 family predicted phage terminase small subunit
MRRNGPPPIPTHLKLLRGNPGGRPLNRNEPQPPPVETTEPPDYLIGHAADEWRRIAPGLRALGLLTALDIHVLAAFCVSYGRWRETEEVIADLRKQESVLSSLIVEGRINPLVKLSHLMAREMLRYAGEFGFTPATRSRISLGISCDDDKFGDLINR